MNYFAIPGLPQKIESVVSKVWNIKIDDIYSKSRNRDIVEARYVCMWYNRIRLKKSFHYCGKLYYKDHSTAVYGIKMVDMLYETNPEFKKKFDIVLNQIRKAPKWEP
jgi:chromosomal replication initiation ATPase DnaA